MKKLFYYSVITIVLSTPTEMTSNVHTPATKKEADMAQEFDRIVYDSSGTLANILHLTKEKHFNPDPQTAMNKAIEAFVKNLDAHSDYLDPETYRDMLAKTSGEFFGIGIVIDNTRKKKDKFLTVIETIPEGPADTAGLLPMDKIVEIDGKSLEGHATEKLTSQLKGERNTTVNIKVMREGFQDLLPFTITRDVIKEQTSVSFHIKEHNIYYLSLTMFSENAARKIEELLQKANKNKYRGLILDLRNNSGGLLLSAVNIAGLFVPKGSLVVVTKNKNGDEIEKYHTTRDPIANNNLPIFILINNFTASAAEILSGVLKIHSENSTEKTNRSPVFLVGSKSFGKGSVQEVIPVNNNSAITLTTSLYYLPNNTTIQGTGIEPDFVIEKTFPPTEQMVWFNKSYGRENAYENYIKVSKNEPAEEQDKKEDTKKSSWLDRQKKMLQTDNQLRETITLINLLHTGNTWCPKNTCNRTKALAFLKDNYITNGQQITIEEV